MIQLKLGKNESIDSEFITKHNLSINTLTFVINNNLIMPRRINGTNIYESPLYQTFDVTKIIKRDYQLRKLPTFLLLLKCYVGEFQYIKIKNGSIAITKEESIQILYEKANEEKLKIDKIKIRLGV